MYVRTQSHYTNIEVPNATAGTMLGLKKSLCIGRYRYRFIIDGVERVNQFASKAVDPRSGQRTPDNVAIFGNVLYVCMYVCVLSPGKLCNIVVISSAPRKFLLPSSAQGPTQTTSQYEVRAA